MRSIRGESAEFPKKYPPLLNATDIVVPKYTTPDVQEVDPEIGNSPDNMAAISKESINTITNGFNSSTSILHPAPSDEEVRQQGFSHHQRKLRKFVEHLSFRFWINAFRKIAIHGYVLRRVIGFTLILIDIVILIVDIVLAMKHERNENRFTFDVISLCFVFYFIIEVNLRLLALGPSQFFHMWFNAIDYVIVVLSSAITVACVVLEDRVTKFAQLLVFGRLVRVTIFIRLFTARKHLEAGARKLVSQNKRRYSKDGFDLDLTYVTGSVIAMSYPSTGKMAMYRNPIKEVARFLDTKHPDRYKVYNLCSERFYDAKHFHGRVERFLIDDHNPPPLSEMFRFTKSVKDFLSQDPAHVIAVHCKGGKGRTGAMVSIWLIESGTFESAGESLEYFGSRRTDLALGRKYQGVETPSQNRYVEYYSYIFEKMNGQMPIEVSLKLEKIWIGGLKTIGKGNGSDLAMEIQDGRGHKLFECDFRKSSTAALVHYFDDVDYLEIELIDGPILTNDIKMMFYCSSDSVPRDSSNVAFFLWCHTAFIEENSIQFRREEIDNPHKPKTWNTFSEEFYVKAQFSKPS